MQSPPVAAELAIAWPFIAESSRPSRRIQSEVWSAGRKKIPSYVCSPWDFYEPFLNLSSRTSLVLCNDRSTLRVIQSCGANEREEASTDESLDGLSLLEIQHKNFVNIHELYLFNEEIFAVTEHVGFSLGDLLQKSICFSETEISYIIGQVLTGIRFIWSRKLDHPRISARNILLSPNGEVKIDPTDFPDNRSYSSADMGSLRGVMVDMMRDTAEYLNSPQEKWSVEAISFLKAISWASPDELSDKRNPEDAEQVGSKEKGSDGTLESKGSQNANLGVDITSNKRVTMIDMDIVPRPSNPVSKQRYGAAKLFKTIKWESPWDSFREHYKLNFGEFVSVASNRAYPHDLFIVKRLKGPDYARDVRLLRTVRHNNFHDMLECFSFEGAYYAVFEHVPISLAHVAKSPPFLTEVELAAILGQILKGLAYLALKGLEHGSLSCSNILLDTDGNIKIAGQERCQELASSDQGHSRDIRALGNITMELMQKYTKDDGAIGVDDLERWPSDCNAVGFLSMTTSATSVDKLVQHPLLQCDWDKVDLKWITEFAAVTTHIGYSYHE
ncbi:hypothetical protein V493_00088 [Pseudogymnoascus sp. VKM F-4281 (FW-2241)]|nr:hypothetical protein V493_00088 [Pseudogymnoascus sp. VKM F-4281 (FW-2241)]